MTTILYRLYVLLLVSLFTIGALSVAAMLVMSDPELPYANMLFMTTWPAMVVLGVIGLFVGVCRDVLRGDLDI